MKNFSDLSNMILAEAVSELQSDVCKAVVKLLKEHGVSRGAVNVDENVIEIIDPAKAKTLLTIKFSK